MAGRASDLRICFGRTNLLRALSLTIWILQTFRSEWFNPPASLCLCHFPVNPSESLSSGSLHPAHPESFVDLLDHEWGLLGLTPCGPLRAFMTHITTQTILLSKDNSSKKEKKEKTNMYLVPTICQRQNFF